MAKQHSNQSIPANQTDEIWKPVPGFEYLEASSIGRIRHATGNKWVERGYIFKSTKIRGYLSMRVRQNGKLISIAAHRLVAFAFLGIPATSNLQINHINGVKTDNRAENLEWVTPKQNVAHAIMVLGNSRAGECSPFAAITTDIVRAIHDDLIAADPILEIARRHQVSQTTIYAIKRREIWREALADLPTSYPRPRRYTSGRPRQCSGAKLTAEDVAAIRSARAAGVQGVELAKKYGVGKGAICDIHRGRTWKDR